MAERRTMRAGVALLAMAASLTLASCVAHLPAVYQGQWNATASGCADPDSTTGLRIDRTRLQYYEWGGEIVSFQQGSDGRVVIQMDGFDVDVVDDNDRPVISRRAAALDLSSDRNGLLVSQDDMTEHYVRCKE